MFKAYSRIPPSRACGIIWHVWNPTQVGHIQDKCICPIASTLCCCFIYILDFSHFIFVMAFFFCLEFLSFLESGHLTFINSWIFFLHVSVFSSLFEITSKWFSGIFHKYHMRIFLLPGIWPDLSSMNGLLFLIIISVNYKGLEKIKGLNLSRAEVT